MLFSKYRPNFDTKRSKNHIRSLKKKKKKSSIIKLTWKKNLKKYSKIILHCIVLYCIVSKNTAKFLNFFKIPPKFPIIKLTPKKNLKKYSKIILHCIVLYCIVSKKTAKFRIFFKFPPKFPTHSLKKIAFKNVLYCIVLYCIIYCIKKNGKISQHFQISAQISTQNPQKIILHRPKKKIF